MVSLLRGEGREPSGAYGARLESECAQFVPSVQAASVRVSSGGCKHSGEPPGLGQSFPGAHNLTASGRESV